MTNRLPSLRRQAARTQAYRCYYCNQPMWDDNPTALVSGLGLTKAQAKWFRCTAEHLHAKSQGGRDSRENIVAACLYCNRTRHVAKRPLAPHEYKHYVVKRMRAGRWLASMFRDRL